MKKTDNKHLSCCRELQLCCGTR